MIFGGLDKHHPFYMAWCNMKSRCRNPNSTQYPWYGGRGISYCIEWESFKAFYDDMFPTWVSGLSLDRIDPNEDYYKDNCRWTSKQTQSLNRNPRTRPTHCIRGHELSEDNVYYYSNGSRTCKICRDTYNKQPDVVEKKNSNKRVNRLFNKIVRGYHGR